MTHEQSQSGAEPTEPATPDKVALLLQKALAHPPEPQIHFLPNIQERIRRRTKGRYFSKRREAFRDPIILLLIAAVFVLLVAAVALLVFEPLVQSSETAAPPPANGKGE